MAKILKREQVGFGLEVNAEHNLQVKAGRNVTVDAGGVHVDLPAIPEVPKAIKDIRIVNTTVTKTFTDNTTSTEQLPAPTVDVKLSGITFEAGKLKATLSDGTSTEAEFTTDFLVTVVESLTPEQKTRVVQALLSKLVDSLKGEEVKDFADNKLGYFLKTTL